MILSRPPLMMYKGSPMTRTLLPLFLSISSLLSSQTSNPSAKDATADTISARTAGLEKHDGFLPYHWDAKKGELLIELSPATLDREFLYFTGLGSGVGSIKVFADRSSTASSAVCRFRRAGPKVLVIAKNLSFRAENGSADLKRSVELSFPTSVLAALPVEAEQGGALLVDANPLLLRDATDLLSQLHRPTQAVNGVMVRQESKESNWRLDDVRSVVDLDASGSFPLNTELEALLTFTNEGEADLNQPDTHVLSIREHHSFVALPELGFEPREADPRVGFFGEDFKDFSQ